jgi:hypothetical protein
VTEFAGDATEAEEVDEDEGIDDEEETEEEIEIEVKIFETNSSAKVKIDDNVTEFIFETTDEEEIKKEIVNETSLPYEDVNNNIKFEIEDGTSSLAAEAEDEDDEDDDTEEQVD